MTRARAITLTAALGLAVLDACGGGSQGEAKAPAGPATSGTTGEPASSSSPSSSVPAPTASAGGVDPNAREVNQAGDIPDNQVFVDFIPATGGYRLTVPEGWARSEANGAVTFTDKLNSVRLETVAPASAPTVASVTNNDLPAIRAASSRFEAGTVTTVTRRAGPVVLATYRADGPPSPVTGKVVHDDVERYAFWRDGTTVVVTLSGPQGADNVDPWRIVTDSFQWR